MNQLESLLITLPLGEDDVPRIWALEDGQIIWEGDADAFFIHHGQVDLEHLPVTALVPASVSTLRYAEPKGLDLRQELAVARIEAQQESLGDVVGAAFNGPDGRIIRATVDRLLLEQGLERIAKMGFTVRAASPVAALFHPPSGELWRIACGDDNFLRSTDLVVPDEPDIQTLFFGDAEPLTLDRSQVNSKLANLDHAALPDFLEGQARSRPSHPLFSPTNRFWIKRLLALAVLLILASGAVYWGRLQWSISQENEATLAALRKIDPSISDVSQADAAINRAMARSGFSQGTATSLAVAIWQAAQSSEDVALTEMRIGKDAMLFATLSAPDADRINRVLIALQRSGYTITATPRRDQSGATLVDLSVRMP